MAKLKICGLTCKEDIEAVNGAKPDFAGFIIEVPGRRRSLTAEQVKVLVKGLDKEILPVGVFVNAAPELPISLLRDGTLWAAQLHGDEDEDYIEKIQNMTGKPVIKGEPAKNGSGIPHKAAKLRPHRLSCRLRSCCEEFLHVRFLYCRSIAFLLFGYSPVSRLPSEPKPCEMAASDI